MCQTSPTKSPVETRRRTSAALHILTPDYPHPSRSADGYADDCGGCDTPKIMLGKGVGPALEFGLVARTVPDVLHAEVPETMFDDAEMPETIFDEPVTPRGAMLPPAPREPPAIKNVSALSPGWERTSHMFDDGFVLSPMKTLRSPGDLLSVSGLWSGESRDE